MHQVKFFWGGYFGVKVAPLHEFSVWIDAIPKQMRKTQNTGLVSNWLSFAQIERDDRVSVEGECNKDGLK
jgi:hypothetical protein